MLPIGNIRQCQVTDCNSDSSGVFIYSVKRSKDREKFFRWTKILNVVSSKNCIFACQRHFPAGAPTRNHPDPNPALFNPVPDTEHEISIPQIFQHRSDEAIIGPDGKSLPSPVVPPPGSVLKLAPNATLIDLKKIKEQDLTKPFRIEEVVVMIDEKDSVKVVDYGPKDRFSSYSETISCRYHKSKKIAFYNNGSLDQGRNMDDFASGMDESTFDQFYDPSLGNVLENMRQLHIDCNTVIVDVTKKYVVYAHRAILISKSPYFFKQLYIKQKKNKKLYQFCKVTLPFEVEHGVLDAVISYIYTGSLHYLLHKSSAAVKQLLSLLEMKDALEIYEQEFGDEVEEPGSENVKHQSEQGEAGENILILPFMKESEEKHCGTEVREEKDTERRKRRKVDNEAKNEVSVLGEDYVGKLKVSVQKLVENALNPFLTKIEELFDPTGSTLHIAKTSQHIITLWHPDILLTKLFDGNELNKFFSEVMHKVLEKHKDSVVSKNVGQQFFEIGIYTVESLSTETGNANIDDLYTKANLGLDDATIPVETLTVGDMQIINYQQMLPRHISKYAHMIAMYRFNIYLKKRDLKQGEAMNAKVTLIPSLLEGESLNDDASGSVAIEDLVTRMVQGDDLLSNDSLSLTRSCFQQVNLDLKRRVIADLELYINSSYHEEMIMHIFLGQMDDNILPLTVGVFLAKGCSFCRKKECKAEDLTMPITPDNPVCPDRQCIRQNLQCDICHKQMATSKSLARHKYSVHDIQIGDMPGLFICIHCGETFSKKWKLNMHEREHEDRKMELTCQYCKKKIRGSLALKKHINLVHEAKPQFSCEFCPKAFKRRETLSVHNRIHTGEKPFRCTHCEYASETKGNLKCHIIRKHKVQYVSINSSTNPNQIIEEQSSVINDQTHIMPSRDGDQALPDDQVMAATIAHSLSDCSFIITSENSPSSMVP